MDPRHVGMGRSENISISLKYALKLLHFRRLQERAKVREVIFFFRNLDSP